VGFVSLGGGGVVSMVKILKDTDNLRTLIIFPKNLVSMWEDYDHKYDLGATVIPISYDYLFQKIETSA